MSQIKEIKGKTDHTVFKFFSHVINKQENKEPPLLQVGTCDSSKLV